MTTLTLERNGEHVRLEAYANGNARMTIAAYELFPDSDADPQPLGTDCFNPNSADERGKWVERIRIPEPLRDEAIAIAEQIGIEVVRLRGNPENAKAPDEHEFFPPVIPWESPVRLTAILDSIVNLLERHILLPPHAARVMALWVAHTYCLRASDFTPYLWIWSATPECGKSTTCEFLAELAYRPLVTSNISGAGMFHVIETYQPTLFHDELDSAVTKGERADDVKNILNAGFKRGAYVVRCETVNNTITPKMYRVYCPKVISGVGKNIAPATLSRTIPIRLKKATPEELQHIARPRDNVRAAACEPVRRQLQRWANDECDELAQVQPSIPPEIISRKADLWAPLFAIAERAGPEWTKRAHAAALAMANIAMANEDAGVMLLHDIRNYFNANAEAKGVKSAELVDWLRDLDNRPWADWKREGLKPHHVARILGNFDDTGALKPKTIRFGTKTDKGYYKAAFTDVWKRYPPEPEDADVTPPTASVTPHVTGQIPLSVTSQAGQPQQVTSECDGVTDSEGGRPEQQPPLLF